MNSSYKKKIDFGDIISTITFLKNPKKIVEFGILEGFSLMKFVENSKKTTSIDAYDIFEKFNGNHAVKYKLDNIFNQYTNVNIQEGDFYEGFKKYPDKSIDILHIDIANNGEIYEFVFNNYVQKIADNGVILLEGGSETRDNIEWMIKYNKPKIQPVLEKYKHKYNIKVIGTFPSITMISL
jgi:predicted O-methyltransferase YrrM|tara:strand:- start:155 stop:697 length:543 start_codon:yes stop_codon:yes gene_type:complete